MMTTQPAYRVIAILTNDFGKYNLGKPSQVDETIKWSGADVDQLSREYPPSDIFGADPLGHSEIEDGLIRYDYRFERQRYDGTWEEIDDPRRRITPMTELEREIDAENRRRFPGDYINYECDRCGDHGCPECDDPRGYDCDNCSDRGCNQCDPLPDCVDCNDQGCSECDPERFPVEIPCGHCGRWFKDASLNEECLCKECEESAKQEPCNRCGCWYLPEQLNDRGLCAECAIPRCSKCDWSTVDSEGDVCSYCDVDDHTSGIEDMFFCYSCGYVHTDPSLTDDDLCQDCVGSLNFVNKTFNSLRRRFLRRFRPMK